MSENILGRDPWSWRSDMDAPRNILAPDTLSQGPAPTGYDRVRDGIYNLLGGKPANAWGADKLATAFDVGTLGLATGAYDGAQELARTGRPAAMVAALMPGMKPVAAAAKAAAPAAKEAAQGIRAYHGSPHDFDRFDMSKIGTGEGAQAYGHGLYFAESEDVARSYRDNLAPRNAPPGQNVALGWLKWHGDKDKAASALKTEIARTQASHDVTELKQALDHLESGTVNDKPGRMYEVNIKANPDDFLDWDKPLSQQSDRVRAVVSERFQNAAPSFREALERAPMAEVHRLMAPRGSGPSKQRQMVEASRVMREAGVPGIKYFDNGSRVAGEGSRNYVAFDASLIEILRKYGLLPPAALGAAGAAQDPAQAAP